ncbi:hypothetical protein RSOLAG1IB_10084 [Rhizoctonia solani AG-1 IB]|uniref:Jacalin-type lectin domain-containing protein n=1 Tax=Thanatephorus cucumeris (strain AG1-IB / isolate 7/3/14) TaxID=1108050 RepID=A0A0B7FU80_THACB|nr:hypothetical protein RSOLAG1IB_10084 [Rhizoctonia solani AG-1 IB]
MGRCSAQYGAHTGIPTASKSQGGLLVGFSGQTSIYPSYKEVFTAFQGIWRHDVLPRAPREEDVFSEYFGNKGQKGCVFNDRVIVRNSESIRISSIEVWAGAFIGGIRVMYIDNKDGRGIKSSTVRRGGPGGAFHRFELEDGEHVVSVAGKYEEGMITQLCFVTNQGRASEVFGGGKGQPFSAVAPRERNGKPFRLLYLCGKKYVISLHLPLWTKFDEDRNSSDNTSLTGAMFVWTPTRDV